MRRYLLLAGVVLIGCPAWGWAIDLHQRHRSPKPPGQVVDEVKAVGAEHIGIVVIDMWNWHWCMTAAQRVSAMVPRMNRALSGARQLGMTVFWAPTDVASQYIGSPPRMRALATPLLKLPEPGKGLWCRWTFPTSPCMCGEGIRCGHNYGWDAMHPDLAIDAQRDWIISGPQELYSICKQRGITHLIYAGVHTNLCVLSKPAAMDKMTQLGLTCLLARDLTDAGGGYKAGAFTPDDSTRIAVEDVERAKIPTIDLLEAMRDHHAVAGTAPTEYVHFSPWGLMDRPYQFREEHVVTLTWPHLEGATVHYTLDGSEPTEQSPTYAQPIHLTQTTRLRAVAYVDHQPVSLPSEGYYVKLPAEAPKPEIHVEDLKPIREPYADAGRTTEACFWSAKMGQSYNDQPLRVAMRKYSHGLGMRANAYVRYERDPKWKRFVAKVGVDDHIVEVNARHMLARYPSIIFKVYLDGELAAQSPIMRVQQQPWSFDVAIEQGTKQIQLVMTDADTRSAYDLGDWVDAGFITAGEERAVDQRETEAER